MVNTNQQWRVKTCHHPGSSVDDIFNEPDWRYGREHHIGALNQSRRRAGHTHTGDDHHEEREADGMAQDDEAEKDQDPKKNAKEGRLLNFQDLMKAQPDFHLRHLDKPGMTWRFVLDTTEDWVKNAEDWPVNQEKKKKEKERKRKETDRDHANQKHQATETREQGQDHEDSPPQQEHEMNQEERGTKDHGAYAINEDQNSREDGSEKENTREDKLRKKYTAQELSLLKLLEDEKSYISTLKQNDGRQSAPKNKGNYTVSIDEADQITPDNWIPRSASLIRLTGKHPLNAQPDLTDLFDAGFVTPNDLHFVRNHGAVPHLLWKTHRLDIQHGKVVYSMDDLTRFEWVNLPVTMACSSNRRKELNMMKKTKGYHWGAGAVGCAYWKGPLLRHVLAAAGVSEDLQGKQDTEPRRYWVHFEGADTPNDVCYATSIPLQYAMDPTSDIILAYEMNSTILPPDHGYPIRLIVPGYIGGRCVKWLRKIWIDDKESDSYWHYNDNRTLPSFVTEMDGEFADAMMHHPDTACYEQNLNSVITKPVQGERLPVATEQDTYRIEGFAYDGGGHEIQRVEVSLDNGHTWLYCRRRFMDAPIRHGNKFWTWVFWYIDITMEHLIRADGVIARCFNVFKNTQPEKPSWNVMGTMNNCWYQLKIEMTHDPESKKPCLLFRHPAQPGSDDGGWMQPSYENRLSAIKREAGAPEKQFTRDEIEKHDNKDDCWIVVDNKVYDATSVLSWHPGGAATVLTHAGKVHYETTSEFSSIHDDFAYAKLKECVLGVVTEKTRKFIQQSEEAAAREKRAAASQSDDKFLQKHRWMPCRLKKRDKISHDTNTYTFELPDNYSKLGLGTCQHVQIGFHLRDKMVIRPYTPTRPVLAAKDDDDTECDGLGGQSADHIRDGDGTFDLTVKTYFPSESQPGGALSNILDCLSIGEEIEVMGPTGDIIYYGQGKFSIEGSERHFRRVSMVLGGSGMTPGFSLIARILLTKDDTTEIRVIDANKSENDILLRDELDELETKRPQQFKMTHVLDSPDDEWKGKRGFVNAEIIKECLFRPEDDSVLFLCGPPVMIQKAVLPAVKEWGYKEHENCYGF